MPSWGDLKSLKLETSFRISCSGVSKFASLTWLRLSPRLPSASTGRKRWGCGALFRGSSLGLWLACFLFDSCDSLIARLCSLSKNSLGFSGGGWSSGGGGSRARGELRSKDRSSSSVDLSSCSESELRLSRRLIPCKCGSRNVFLKQFYTNLAKILFKQIYIYRLCSN